MGKYKVTNDLNIRISPSINAQTKGILKKDALISIVEEKAVSEVQKSTKEKVKITWVRFKHTDGQYYWCSKKFLKYIPTDYLARVRAQAKVVYPKIVDLKCVHKNGSDNFSEIKSKKIVNCSGAVSSVLKLAGCMSDGEVGHRSAVTNSVLTKKNTIAKTVVGLENTKHIKWIWVGKKYANLPTAYKKEGIIYVWDSNIGISAGNGYFWSCNNSGQRYISMGMVKKNKGYCKDKPILVVGIPQKE